MVPSSSPLLSSPRHSAKHSRNPGGYSSSAPAIRPNFHSIVLAILLGLDDVHPAVRLYGKYVLQNFLSAYISPAQQRTSSLVHPTHHHAALRCKISG